MWRGMGNMWRRRRMRRGMWRGGGIGWRRGERRAQSAPLRVAAKRLPTCAGEEGELLDVVFVGFAPGEVDVAREAVGGFVEEQGFGGEDVGAHVGEAEGAL